MPVQREWVLFTYNDERDGQVAIGSLETPWFDTSGFSKLLISSFFAGGTTTLVVEQSVDGVTNHKASSDLLSTAQGSDGVELNVAFPYARVVVTQTAAETTNANLAVKGSD